MSNFKLKRSNDVFYATVPTNVILGPNIPSATPTPINLIGRNKISYGEAQNENFLWLTENFSNTTAPSYAIRGQLWYDYTNDYNGGELKIASIDSPSSTDWVSIATVVRTNSTPTASHPGRFIIYKDNQLKVRMDDDWYNVVTELPKNKQYQSLLSIINNDDIYNDEYTTVKLTGAADCIISRFDDGGYITSAGLLGGLDDGVLRYGSSYQFEADILVRYANNPQMFSTWKITGCFSVDSELTQSGYGIPDPRRVTILKSTVTRGLSSNDSAFSTWTVKVQADSTAPVAGTSVEDVVDGDYYGLVFKANAGYSDASATIKTQWNISFRISGVSSSKNATYSSI